MVRELTARLLSVGSCAVKAARSLVQYVLPVLSCSAMKRSYRDLLRALPGTRFTSLRGTPEDLARRLEGRTGNFMPPGLLPSQLAALEDPSGEPDVLTLDLGPPAPALAREVGQRLGLPGLARRGPQGADP